MDDNNNKIINQSNDHAYFTITPEIVLAATDPYETRFWMTVKMVAGDKGECYAGIRLLAQLSKMSVGKANQCRKKLISMGILQGGPKDKNDPNSQWIITVPDLWERNFTWRSNAGDSLYDRARAYVTFWEEKLWEKRKKKSRAAAEL